jgi:hypothetical protein
MPDIAIVTPDGTQTLIAPDGTQTTYDVLGRAAGVIDQSSPTPSTLLTVSGDNTAALADFRPELIEYRWESGVDVVGAGATYATGAGDAGKAVRRGWRGPNSDTWVFTPAVTVQATSFNLNALAWTMRADFRNFDAMVDDSDNPITVADQNVRRILDQSGNGNNLLAAVQGLNSQRLVSRTGHIDINSVYLQFDQALDADFAAGNMNYYTVLRNQDAALTEDARFVLLSDLSDSGKALGFAQKDVTAAATEGSFGGASVEYFGGSMQSDPLANDQATLWSAWSSQSEFRVAGVRNMDLSTISSGNLIVMGRSSPVNQRYFGDALWMGMIPSSIANPIHDDIVAALEAL